MTESKDSTRRFRMRMPRYSLRSLFIAVAIAAVFIQLTPLVWRQFVRFRDARQYAALQATKTWSSSTTSLSIDNGRGVPDDFVILVRSGESFGCFVPRNQFRKGESVEYDWYYRTDGRGTFYKNDPKVKTGHSIVGPYVPGSGQSLTITFGPFSIPWSGNGPGWGFVYYDYNPPDRSAPDILRICATDCKEVTYIDARDAKWIYKAFVADTGLNGNVDSKTTKEAGQKPNNSVEMP